MTAKFAFGILLCLLNSVSFAQLRSGERAAVKNMAKHRWEKAREQLEHVLKKDTLNAASKFLYSRYYFNSSNPDFHIDSAYVFINRAIVDYQYHTQKERDRLRKNAIDSIRLVAFRKKIDSAGFERAKSINTEGAFLHFLSTFKWADQRQMAVVLRDEAAYLDAVKANTYEGFLHFIEKYPSAARASEARNTYERLLYNTRTKERSLKSYEAFLKEFPATPYRREVERHIFEISTASGQIGDFVNFLERYPRSSSAGKGRNILFHLLQSQEDPVTLDAFLTDSLRNVKSLNEGFLFPILKDGMFGFMNKNGEMIIRPGMETLYPEYKCGNIQEDVLIVNNRLISRDGRTIFRDSIQELSDLGQGFLTITTHNCLRTVHKSGFTINDCAEEAKLIAGKFIALKQNGQWALYSLSGRSLTLHEWDEIIFVKDVLCFKKNNEYRLITSGQMGQSASDQKTNFKGSFEEVKLWARDRLWVKSKDFEGVLDQRLQPVIPFDKYELKPTNFGAVGRSNGGYILFNEHGAEIGAAKKAKISDAWVAVQYDKTWKLFDPATQALSDAAYDTLRFEGPFLVTFTTDSMYVHFNRGRIQSFRKNALTTFIPGKDSTAFVMVSQDKKKILYNQIGVKLFTVDSDDITYAGEGLFIVTTKGKKGLVDINGKTILPVEYDAIGSVARNTVSLLKNLKFGIYHVKRNKLVKPQYEKNIVIYNDSYFTAYQKGGSGFLNWDNKPVSKFEFEEIQYWNDSTALVKKNFNWFIYNIDLARNVEENIKNVDFIADSPDEKLAIIRQENSYGVASNRRGFIIPATFSNLVNLGSADEPLYFTEKHVEEASIFVVIYYDQAGRMLYRQVYEEEDYEKILCSDN